jgi:hypothetical protein
VAGALGMPGKLDGRAVRRLRSTIVRRIHDIAAYCGRTIEAEGFGGPEIDHELKHRLLKWEIGWFLTPKDARNQQINLRKGLTGLGPKLAKTSMSVNSRH